MASKFKSLPILFKSLNTKTTPIPTFSLGHTRNIFDWLNAIFNSVDQERIKEVGPNRACAEWLIKNGAAVRWCDQKDFFKDYNSLGDVDTSCILEIDASDSAITHHGFPYLKGCDRIQKITLHNCKLLEDQALKYLEHVQHCLLHLQITSCWNITNKGLSNIEKLKNLKTLKLGDLPYVKNPEEVVSKIKSSIPQCSIEYGKHKE